MTIFFRAVSIACLLIGWGYGSSFAEQLSIEDLQSSANTEVKTPVTVPDMIEMTRPGELMFQGGTRSKDDIAKYSPDGHLFIVVLKRGNLHDNTNDYWIQCFHTAQVMSATSGITLVRFSSSSNRPAISQVQWQSNTLLTFLAEDQKETTQLYTFNVQTRRLTKLTHSKDNLTAYAIGPKLAPIIYESQAPAIRVSSKERLEPSLVIEHQSLIDLLIGEKTFDHNALSRLYVQDRPLTRPTQLSINGDILNGSLLYLSPDGRYLVVKSLLSDKARTEWYLYTDSTLRSQLPQNRIEALRNVYQFQLVDLSLKTSRPLLNTPIPSGDYPDLLWSPDSRSVVLSHVLLPLDHINGEETELRKSTKFVAEVSIADGIISPITAKDIRLGWWNNRTGVVTGWTGSWSGAASLLAGTPIAYHKSASAWQEVSVASAKIDHRLLVQVKLVEDMNHPPKLYVTDQASGTTKLLLDLNPQFRNLAFGRVQDLGSIGCGDFSVKAGVYLPAHFTAGHTYPLVIQTHEWTPERFWIDGPFSSAFAAQAFAGKDMVVAQVALNRSHQSTLQEVHDEAQGYDCVIDYLAEKGMVDFQRIGIIGFSRTALGVKYALIHSKYHFAAATIADGSDAGYFKYVSSLNSNPTLTRDIEGINGGVPVEAGLRSWMINGADFNLGSISTPLRLEAYEPSSLFFTWEEFGLLQRLHRPVDFIYIPRGNHVLVRPSDRLASQSGNVGWFSFWLKGEKDDSATRSADYRRWETLRLGAIRDESVASAPPHSTSTR